MNRCATILTRIAAALLLVGIVCCTRQTDRPIITVSIEPQKQLLASLAGDRFDIRCLMGAGGNPEVYDPTVANLLNAERSVAYMALGNIGFEEAVMEKVRRANPDLPVFITSEGMELIYGTHGEGAPDPHTWASISGAKTMVRNMASALQQIDPDRADEYGRNLEATLAHLDSLDAAIRTRLQQRGVKSFLVWHPSLTYFARDYGLQQIAIGGIEGKEQSVASLRGSIDRARESGADVLLLQPDFDPRQAGPVVEQLPGIRTETFNLLDPDWEGQIQRIADTLCR